MLIWVCLEQFEWIHRIAKFLRYKLDIAHSTTGCYVHIKEKQTLYFKGSIILQLDVPTDKTQKTPPVRPLTSERFTNFLIPYETITKANCSLCQTRTFWNMIKNCRIQIRESKRSYSFNIKNKVKSEIFNAKKSL